MLTLQKRLQFAPATAGFVLTGSILLTTSAQAFEFEAMDGEVKGTLNSTLSIGAKYDLEGYVHPGKDERNENDGERSFDGGFVSKVVKFTTELDLQKDNFGFSGRATAYYDHVLMNGSNQWNKNNARDVADGHPDQAGTFPGWSDEVKDNQGRGAKLQHAFVYGDWEFDNGQKLNVKVGDQTHSWGETIFYAGGMRDLNAYDIALATLPGSDGDLNIAQGMVSAEFEFNDEMSLAGFVQYDWDSSILAGRGTFDSDKDLFVPGSDIAYYPLANFGLDAATASGLKANGFDITTEGDYIKVASVGGVQSASDSGQWGVRFKFTPEALPDTEFALYYANYHSSLPFIHARVDGEVTREGARLAGLLGNAALATPYMLSNAVEAEAIYPEDIKLWGASFNTKVWGYTQIAGELTYRENAPIWIDHPDDLLRRMALGTTAAVTGQPFPISLATGATATTDQWYQNIERTPMWDGSLSVIQPFGAVLGTDLMYVVGEVAFQQVSGLDNYDRYMAKGSEAWAREDEAGNASKNADERLDRFSWGYNLLVGANWNDVVTPGLNLKSTFRFTHDVSGNSHVTGRFEEGEKKINMGLTAEYDRMTAKVTWGGDADDILRNGVITGTLGYSF